MPAALKYIPPTNSDRDSFSPELITERQARRDRYLNGVAYYDSKHPEQLDYDPELEPNDNTVINLVKITADRTASFLFPEIPTFQTDPDSVDETDEEKWIKKLLEHNGGLVFLVRLVLRGFLGGHAFVRVKPPKRYPSRSERALPTFTLLDPMAVTIYWNADDQGEVLWYENRYMVGSAIYIQDYVWEPDAGRRGEWRIYTYRTGDKTFQYINSHSNSPHGAGAQPRAEYIDFVAASSFTLVPTEEGEDYARHASDIPPIIEFEHLPHPDDRYGHGEVTQEALQDTINRVWSEINKIVRKHSDPVDVVTGAAITDVEQGDDIMVIEQETAKVNRLEMRSDLTAALAVVQRLVKTYLAVARVVLLEGEAKDLQRVTNASVRTLFIDALAKNEILREAYGSGLKKMITLAMEMSGEKFATTIRNNDLILQWGEPLPVDKFEIAQINAIMLNAGARSKRTAATQLGDNWAFEHSSIEAEAAEQLTSMVETAKAMQAVTPQPAPGATGGASLGKNNPQKAQPKPASTAKP